MARLKSYGRQEILRVRKSLPDSESFIDNRKELAVMTDRKILEKHSARFRPDQFYPKGNPTTWGWKVRGKVKPNIAPSAMLEHYIKLGYEVVSHNTYLEFSK